MQYKDAITELREFASEPLDTSVANPGKLAEIRMAVRTVIKNLENPNSNVRIELRENESKKRVDPTLHKPPKQESKRVRLVDLIRKNGSATEMQIYRQFKTSINDMNRLIAESYGIVSRTNEPTDDGSDFTFHFLAETGREFKEKYENGAPEGHVVVGGGY